MNRRSFMNWLGVGGVAAAAEWKGVESAAFEGPASSHESSSELPLVAKGPRPGEEVDLALLGHNKIWDGNQGVEWDEAREVSRVEVEFEPEQQIPSGESLHLQYWVGNWPPAVNLADSASVSAVDSPWQGEWRTIRTDRKVNGHTLVFRFKPLTTAENANASHLTGPPPSIRRTLKLRLDFNGAAAPVSSLRIYGTSWWNVREVIVQTGCEEEKAFAATCSIYNGKILASEPLPEVSVSQSAGSSPMAVRVKVLYTDHECGSNDRTILTVRGGPYAFGVGVDDIITRGGAYVKALGVFIGDGARRDNFESFMQSGNLRPGGDILSRVSRHPEQTLRQATAGIPPLAMTGWEARHPYRYLALGFPNSREKYGLDFNGNVFISKVESRAMKEDLARMLWAGDEIYWRVGTGSIPDFRERERSARQELLDRYLPLVITHWEKDGIDYEEQVYATMLDSPLDDSRLRGDEVSILFMKVTARNSGSSRKESLVWLHVSPKERIELRGNALFGIAGEKGTYAQQRLRAAFEIRGGSLRLEETPVESDYRGDGVLWTAWVPPASSTELCIKIPFRTLELSADLRRVMDIHFETRLDETLAYWREATSAGMRIQVPDEEFNRFHLAVLQHLLLTQRRDVETGLTMCPCATYDYGIFANETDIQVRLLDMRGLYDFAWRCLRPIVELQGSHPFPGLFTDTSAELHGVRVDKDHDYTMGGYNTDHGWTLWTLSEHYLFTRDRSWLQRVIPNLLKAANWVIEERQRSMQRDPDGSPVPEYGLLPPGDLEDVRDWQHWFAVNGYAYRGLNAAAEAISEIDAQEGARLRQEAAAYRDDIRRAALQAMAIATAVPLRDGTFVPLVPTATALHGRALGWIRNTLYGALTLVDCGIFDAEESVATWILQDYEDNLLMGDLPILEAAWFSRGGLTFQPNLVGIIEDYLRRDQAPQALRIFYNTFATCYYWDVAHFAEGLGGKGLGAPGGSSSKTSDEAAFLINLRLLLVRESADRLYLNFGAPQAWFRPGRTIEVEGAASFFGDVGFQVESHPDQGFIQARVSLPTRNRPREVFLRLRHPEGRRMVRVEMNGQEWNQFSADRETVTLSSVEKQASLRVFYQ